MRRGAASCREELGSWPVVTAVRTGVPSPSPRSRHGWPSASRRRDPSEVGPSAGVAGGEDVRTPARPVVALSASSGPPWGCPSGRSSGRPGVRVSVRTDTLRCPRRCRRPCPRRAGSWSGSVWRAAPAERSGSTCPWAAGGWSPACIGPDGKGMARRWPCLARMRFDRSQGRLWPAFRLRCRLAAGPTRALVQGQGAGRVAGSMGWSRCSPARQGVFGRSRAWCRQWAWARRW